MKERAGKRALAGAVAIAQVGGPTAVINSSLHGFLRELGQHGSEPVVYGIQGGMSGFAEGRFVRLAAGSRTDWLRSMPGAALEAGRKALTEADVEQCVRHLMAHDIRYVSLIGGNGTMWACSRIYRKALEMGYELHVVGIPKTVDNDIMETDHTPGFPSAARFVAHAVRDLAADLSSMRNFEQVRVIETMGRNVGWLTAAAAYFRERSDDAPHALYVPEQAFRMEEMLRRVADVQREIGYCIVVVSEGLKDERGEPIAASGIMNGKVNGQGGKALGGVGSYLASTIGAELGLACRYENLGILQRCASFLVSDTDREEAEAVGQHAARLLADGVTGVMVCIRRTGDRPYRWELGQVPLERVAGIERALDPAYLADGGMDAYREWLQPFMGSGAPYRILFEQIG